VAVEENNLAVHRAENNAELGTGSSLGA